MSTVIRPGRTRPFVTTTSISLIRGLETLPGAQVSNESTIGVSSRRNDIRWESQNCFRLTGGADYGGAVTDFDVTVVSPHSVKPRQIFASLSRPNSDLPPEELVKKQRCTVMDRKHQDKVARLPPQGEPRATFHPLVFTTGGLIGDATWDTIKGWKASVSPGAFDLMMEADVGGIVEGAWENVYAGRRHVGSFVDYHPSRRS